jgi:hypothetical protein
MVKCKGCGRKRPWPNFKLYPNICLVGLRKITKNLRMLFGPIEFRTLYIQYGSQKLHSLSQGDVYLLMVVTRHLCLLSCNRGQMTEAHCYFCQVQNAGSFISTPQILLYCVVLRGKHYFAFHLLSIARQGRVAGTLPS